MLNNFVHLRTHSSYSFTSGIMSPKEIILKNKELGNACAALTDRNSMFGVPEFVVEGQENGIKPIIGCDFLIKNDITQPDNEVPNNILIIAKNNVGYKALSSLLTRANVELPEEIAIGNNSLGKTTIKQSWLLEDEDLLNNCICLSGQIYKGEISSLLNDARIAQLENDEATANLKVEQAKKAVEFYKDAFKDNFYLEVQRTGYKFEDQNIRSLLQFSAQYKIPTVATHNVEFENRNDFENYYYKSLFNVDNGILQLDHKIEENSNQYFKTEAEMRELFKDIPFVIDNAASISRKCNVTIELNKPHLPNFPTPNNIPIEEHLTNCARAGLEDRLKQYFKPEEIEQHRKEYEERLEYELGIINQMGFAGYFMIVSDFISWCKQNHLTVGPGRGSGAGSLVAYCIKITEVNPIPYNLLFERFLNPDRVSMPDFDIDFTPEAKVLSTKYVTDKYNAIAGDTAVGNIATVAYLKTKSTIDKFGELYNAKFLTEELKKPLEGLPQTADALESISKALDPEKGDPRFAQKIMESPIGRKIVNFDKRHPHLAVNTGTHAGGVVISPTKASDFSPLYRNKKGGLVTQYNGKYIESFGLIKFDFLGLQTLSFIDSIISKVNQRPEFKREGKRFNIHDIPLNDEKTYKTLSKGLTSLVFQLESKGLTNIIKEIKPENLEELTAIIALYRPGPMASGMLDSFIARKQGREDISYPLPDCQHELLKKILEPTYGVVIYQEQVMQIAQKLAGYSLGQADLLRRAMGKKKPEEMAKQKGIFCDGAVKNGVDRELAERLFDIIEKFAGYGFNKSHSVAYAMVSYQTAYLKANYPYEYYTCAFNNSYIENNKGEYSINKLLKEARSNGINLSPPNVNHGNFEFETDGEKIYFGLKGLKNALKADISSLKDEIAKNGKFRDVYDLFYRAPISKRTFIALIHAGALNELEPNQKKLIENSESILGYFSKLKSDAKKDADNKFTLHPDLFEEDVINYREFEQRKGCTPPEMFETDEYTLQEKYENECSVMTVPFTGHFFEHYEQKFNGLPMTLPLEKLNEIDTKNKYNPENENLLVAGVISNIKLTEGKPGTKNEGKRMLLATITDGENEVNCSLFYDDFMAQYSDVFTPENLAQFKNKFIAFKGRASAPFGGNKNNTFSANELFLEDDFEELLAENIHIMIPANKQLKDLEPVFEKYKGNNRDGNLPVNVYVVTQHQEVLKATLPKDKYGLQGTKECFAEIRNILGDKCLKFDYKEKLIFAQKANYNQNYQQKGGQQYQQKSQPRI